MQSRGLGAIPLVGNVYLLSLPVAGLFHRRKIPGVVVTDALLDLCRKHAASPDKGRAFFLEFAAKQMAVHRGLGYRAIYLGGVHSPADLGRIMEIETNFAPDDWRGFAREIGFSRPDEFYLFEPDGGTGLCQPGVVNAQWTTSLASRGHNHNVTPLYHLSKAFHSLMFETGRGLAPLGTKLCGAARDPQQGPAWLRAAERVSKSLLYHCRDCGDCSLAETAFLCPESQCAKNQRNGPCGGTRDGLCEVHDYQCIWARAYDRMKYEGRPQELLDHAPVIQNQALRDTSAWANFWLGRDHLSKKSKP